MMKTVKHFLIVFRLSISKILTAMKKKRFLCKFMVLEKMKR
jgi:hypothetical protein